MMRVLKLFLIALNILVAFQLESQNKALQFDGNDDFVYFTNLFPFHQQGDRTIEFWVLRNASNPQSIIWSRPDQPDNNRFNIGTSDRMFFDYSDPTGTGHFFGTGNPFNANSWLHVALVRQGNIYSKYENAVLVESVTDVNPNLPNSVGWMLSGMQCCRFQGEIDELRIWNTARTASQIQANYNKTFNCPQPGLVAYYKFDELENLGQGNAGVNDIRDFSGNNYHGDVRGGATPSTDAPTLIPDADCDGYFADVDCNDNNAAIYPGATEICNGIDDNCDGVTDGLLGTNNALKMDDVDDWVELSQHASNLIFNSPATIEFWFKANFDHRNAVASENNFSAIWGLGNGEVLTNGSTFRVIYGSHSNAYLNERFSVDNTNLLSSAGEAFVDNNNVQNQWHHYALVCSGSQWKFYVDGVFVSSIIASPSSSNYIGKYGDNIIPALLAKIGYNSYVGSGGFLNGYLDEFRLWNTARTPSQILNHYNKTFLTEQNGLVAYYKFDQLEDLGQGNAGSNDIRDFSGNNYHGDVRGGAFTTCDAPVLSPCSDADGDGYTDCQNDCNDNDASIHPDAAEICNGIDENCDNLVDENLPDSDGDNICNEVDPCPDTHPQGQCLDLPSNAGAWWSGDNHPNDLIGSNHATLMGGATYGTGKVDAAFSFNGSTAYADIGNLDFLQNADAITVSAWVFKNSASNTRAGFVGKWNTSGSPSNTFLLYDGEQSNSQKGGFFVQFSDNSSFGIVGNSNIPVGAWVLVTAVWRNSDGFMGLYKNGVLETSVNGQGVGKVLDYHTAYTAKIGAPGILPGSNWLMNGKIDEVLIFDRALDACEIEAMYLAGATGIAKEDWFVDNDNDGYGDASTRIYSCNQPIGTSTVGGDCNDSDPAIHPGATEICGNNTDENCDGTDTTNGLSFDGSNDFISVPSSTYFNGDFTVEAWVYPRSYNNYSRIFDFGNGAGSNNVWLGFVGTSGRLAIEVWNGSGSRVTSPNALPLNQWTHVVVSLSGNTASMYWNGNLVVSGTMTPPNNIVRNSNFIGRSNWGGDAYNNFIVDDFRIWNITKTQAEIQEKSNCELNGNETGLVLYYKFNQGIASGNNLSNNIVFDNTSNGHNGTLTNFSLSGSVSNWISSSSGACGSCNYSPEICNGLDDDGDGLVDEGFIEFTMSSTPPLCGNPNGTAIVTPTLGSGDYTYQWSNGQTTPTAINLSPNVIYSLTLTDNIAGCKTYGSVTLLASDHNLSLSLQPSQPNCFSSTTGAISTVVAGGQSPYSYTWSTGGTTSIISNLPAGSYSVTIQDANGCSRTATTALSYQQPASHIVPDVSSVTLCQGEQISLSLINASSANWSNGVNSLSTTVQPSSTTNIYVNGLSPTGCTFEDSILVIVDTAFPAQPSNLLPVDGAMDLNNTVFFSWSPSANALRYDLYVWLASANQPTNPTIANINGINRSYTIPSPVYGEAYNWQLVAKGTTCNTASEIRTFTLRNLPDLTVQSITAPSTGFSGQPLTVSWEVKNIGLGYTGFNALWRDQVYLSDDQILNPGIDKLIGDVQNFSALFTGESYSNTATFTVPIGLGGNFYIIIQTNKNNFPFESNQSNNQAISTAPVEITLSPNSDLVITAASAPQNSFSGQPFPVSWTVKNQGIGETNVTYWEDRVFITQDTIGFSNSIQVAAKARTTLLEKDSSYSFSVTAMNVPLNYSGQYYLVFETDRSNNVWEFVFENNNRKIIPINILLTPPPDLVVTNVTAPDTLRYGANATYKFTVKNQGVGPMNSAAANRVLLANNPNFQLSGAFELANFGQNPLVQGDSTVFLKNIYIPYNLSPGTYYSYVYADANNNIFEHLAENNNIGIAANTSSVSVLLAPDLVLQNIQAPATIEPGTQFSISWEIKNQGLGSILNAASKERIYLSSSATSLSGAYLLLDFNIPISLNPGAVVSRSKTVSVPCGFTPGVYYVHIIVDNDNQIPETDNNNNSLALANPVQALSVPCPTYDLALTEITGPDTISLCTPFTVQWKVTNLSPTTANFGCEDGVALSTDTQIGGDIAIGNTGGQRNLTPGSSYVASTTISITNPAIQGNYYLLVNRGIYCYQPITDINQSNNYLFKPVFVKQPTPPDLVVSSVVTPSNGTSGQQVSLNYTVANNGIGPTTAGSWTDKFFLSTDAIYGGDTYLGSQVHSGNLQPGQSYSNNLNLNIPVTVGTGNYYIIVVTDFENYSCEFSGESNNTASSYIYLVQPLPSDLVVVNVTHPVSGVAGQPVSVSWKVRNIGNNTASGAMREAVYLSSDTEWDASDALLGFHTKNIFLLPGQETPFNLSAPITGIALGEYYVIVRTDILDNINEIDNENNSSTGVAPISVDVPELPIGTPLNAQLTNNTPIYYRIEVPPNLVGETMLVSIVSADSVEAGNQLYLKYGLLPSFSDFDFLYSNPLFGNQLITIPSLEQGTIYLLGYGISSVGSIQNVKLEARILPFGIQSINANKGGDNGYVTAEIRGAKFTPDMLVSLRNGTDTIHADTLIYVNAAKVFARFYLQGRLLGKYDVIASKPTNETALLPDGFEIVPGGPVNLSVVILHPPFVISYLPVPSNNPFTISVEFKNESNVDIPIPTIPVKSLGGAPLAFTSNELQTTGGQLELLVPLVELNGPPGILRAGGQGSIQLFTTTLGAAIFMALVP